jgi:hypothetical protein
MKAITITREYGAGGGEVANRLAEALGWKVLDRDAPSGRPDRARAGCRIGPAG